MRHPALSLLLALAACGARPPEPLEVTGLEPYRGSTRGGTRVVLTGAGFVGGMVVTFGGRQALDVVVASPTGLSCTTPDGLPGLVAVTVRRPDGAELMLNTAYIFDAPPTATAPGDLVAALGSRVTLDGARSTDPEHLPLWASWTLEVPAGSGAALSGADAPAATFTPDVPGEYLARLWVTDEAGNTAGPAELRIATSATASRVPDTGRTHCRGAFGAPIPCPARGQPGFGLDASYVINPPALAVGPDTVEDLVTGLTWQRAVAGRFNWYEASGTPDARYNPLPLDVCGGLDLGGHRDWRLPTLQELATLLRDDGVYSLAGVPLPATDFEAFPGTAGKFWTTDVDSPDVYVLAYVVDFDFRELGRLSALVPNYQPVRCVRGLPWGPTGLVDNGDGTASDAGTGLTWELHPPVVFRTWPDAVVACEGLVLGGHDDWRLPSFAEMATLQSPTCCRRSFPDAQDAAYWTSTGGEGVARTAMCLCGPYTGAQEERTYQLARCVR